MLNKIRDFAADETGATAIEYGLIAALVSIAGITAFNMVGDSIGAVFTKSSTDINNAIK